MPVVVPTVEPVVVPPIDTTGRFAATTVRTVTETALTLKASLIEQIRHVCRAYRAVKP